MVKSDGIGLYEKIAKAMKQAAYELNIEIEWGGDWESFKERNGSAIDFQIPFELAGQLQMTSGTL